MFRFAFFIGLAAAFTTPAGRPLFFAAGDAAPASKVRACWSRAISASIEARISFIVIAKVYKCLAVSLSMLFGVKSSILAGTMAAIGASVCCVGPLVLLMLGVSGAWISHFTAFEPFRPYFIGLTLLFLFLAFRKLYLVKRACATGDACADDKVLNRQRLMFWFVTVSLLLLVAFPWYAPRLF